MSGAIYATDDTQGDQPIRLPSVFKDLGAATAAGSIVTIWTPATGYKVRFQGVTVSVSAACSLLFEDNSAGAGNFLLRTPKLLADTPYTFDLGNGIALAAVNNVLKVTSSAAANITGTVYGQEHL